MKPPMAHKIKRPFDYIPSNETDIKVRFDRIREQQKRVVVLPTNVEPMRKAAK